MVKRTTLIVLVTALVTVLAYTAITPLRVEAQAQPHNYFQFDCESYGCIYDFGGFHFEAGQRVVREVVTWPGEAVRNMFWLQINDYGAGATDYNVTYEVVRVNYSNNTGVVKFILNKPARDFVTGDYLHAVWSP